MTPRRVDTTKRSLLKMRWRRPEARRFVATDVPRTRGWLAPVAVVLAGIVMLLYPVVATQYNNAKAREFSQEYNSAVHEAAPLDLSGDLDDAAAYNSTLAGIPILDPWLSMATDPSSPAYRQYSAQLSRFPVMARLRVPTASVDLPIYHGTSSEVIAKGVGHLYGTALPVGGLGTHSVLTSHTGMANATLFDHLTSVREGDLIYVDVAGETLAYRVDQIKVILPTEMDDLLPVAGRDYLTLFTCTPYAVNTHRLLVRGERVPFTPAEKEALVAADEPFAPWDGWMWALSAGAIAGLAAMGWIMAHELRRRPSRG